ncbi:MATE family efflux transporter [Motilimonas sp. KMU-193]|uniref:MATE family efflux transporter n=1 Tax=Motilimonas sp. KMU-193 TaxID=3388668 RepID=UPI00396B0B0F
MHSQSKSTIDRAFYSRLFAIALPFALQLLLYAVLGLVDIMMVSQLGESSVAAVGLSNRIFYFNLVLILGITGGVNVLAAQYFGNKDNGGVRRCLLQAILASAVFSVPFIVLYSLAPEQFLQLASDDAELVSLSAEYMQITGISLLFTCLVVPIEAALRATGDSKPPTLISVVAIAVNIGLNWLLIFGNLGFPELGVAGSAWGTTIARLVQTVLILWLIWRQKQWLMPVMEDLKGALTRKHVKLFAGVAIPVLLHDGGWALGTLVYTFIYGQMGVEALAIMSLLAPLEGCIYAFFLGFALACSTMLGHELGADRYEHAWSQSKLFLWLGTGIAALVGISLFLLSEQIVPLFGKLGTETMQNAVYVLLVLAAALFIKVFNTVAVIGVLRSGGDIKFSALINLCCMWGIGIPLVYISALHWLWPLYLVYLLSMSEEVVKACLVIYRLVQRKWLNNLVGKKDIEAEEVGFAVSDQNDGRSKRKRVIA